MSRQVTINNTTYTLPLQADEAPWGSDLSDIIQALIDVANTVTSPGDISTTTFVLANNQASTAPVTGLAFDPALVRSATVTYSIYRSTTTDEVAEHGVMLIAYKSTDNSYEIARYSVGDAGVEFSIPSTGQAQFTSSNLAGASYAGSLKFNAKAFVQ